MRTDQYPREGSTKHKGSRASNAEDAFADWIYEMYHPHGKEAFDAFVRVTEQRGNGDTLLHVLLRGVPSEYIEKQWRWRWFEISAGGAWERPLDEKIEGLFKYFFYKVHCDIECCIAGDIMLFRADDYARQ